MRTVLALAALLLACARAAQAHEGPPFPVLVDEAVGPYTVSLWADPDIGVGTFYVLLDPREDDELAPVRRVELDVAREDGGGTPRSFSAEPMRSGGAAAQYEALVDFPEQAWFDVRLRIEGESGGGTLRTRVEATPPGFGGLGLAWYLAPFLGVGALWARVLVHKRRVLSRLHDDPAARPQADPES